MKLWHSAAAAALTHCVGKRIFKLEGRVRQVSAAP